MSIHSLVEIGTVQWSKKDIIEELHRFLEVYKSRPVKDNEGGMKAPHMFATWFMVRKLKPKYIIESGVWKGQGTWLLEQAAPDAQIFSIDPKLHYRKYIGDKVTYYDDDFSTIDWSEIGDKENALLFFDDHQNALTRLKQSRAFGFKKIIFEDNYPVKHGDCYSLKKAFSDAGLSPTSAPRSLRSKLKQLLKPAKTENIPPNSEDRHYLEANLKTYYEFPPIFKKEKTRWGDAWNEENYPTKPPLLNAARKEEYKTYFDEAAFYTWICLVELKD